MKTPPKKTAFPRRCVHIAGVFLAMAASLSTGRSEVLLDEQFADGERTSQSPPVSAAWFLEASSSAYTSAVADDAWTILPPSPPSKISAVSYFSASPVSLAAGDSLTISLRIRPTHAKGSLRVGLFNSGLALV